jgi:hypothetical protein
MKRTTGLAGVMLAVLAVVLIAALANVNYRYAEQAPGGNDFLARWVPARAWIVEGTNPYDPAVSERSQRMIYGRPADRQAGEDVAHFVYPLPAMIFFAPFAGFDFTMARALWMTLLELCLLGLAFIGIALAEWRPGRGMLACLVLFSVLWYHGFRAVIVGQFAPIEAILLTGALLCVQRRRDGLAGLLLALSLAKPQMAFLILPFLLLWGALARRWSLIVSTCAFSLALLGGSIAVMPDWPILWLRQVADYPSYTSIGSPLSILGGSSRVSDWVTRILSGLLLVELVVEWVRVRAKEGAWFRWTAALTLVITNLIAFRTATTNYVILIPVLVLLLQTWADRWGRRGVVLGLSTLALLFVGLWGLFLLTVEGNVESAAMYLPLPILLLLGLWWNRWWATSRPRLNDPA